MKPILLFLFTCIALRATSQNGAVLLQVQPTNATVRINGQEFKNLTRVEMPAGVYTIESWAPGREYIKDTLEIFADGFVKYVTILPVSSAYKVYSQQMEVYSKAKTNNGVLKGSIVVFNAGITTLLMALMPGDVKQHRDAANTALDNYNNATGVAGIVEFKHSYESESRMYEEGLVQRRKYLYKTLPAIAAMYGISVFAWTRIKKAPPRPTLNAPNPFSTMDLRLVPEFGSGYQPTGMGFQFSMKF